jgi:hypothetical protein
VAEPEVMSRRSVLAAAAALQDFTTGQLAAYSGAEPDFVERQLRTVSHAIFRWDDGPAAGDDAAKARWHVGDADALRASIVACQRGAGAAREAPEYRQSRVSTRLGARLLLAEESLIGCGQQSAESRRLIAATAKNHLRQCLASLLPSERSWWEIELTAVDQVTESLRTESGAITPSRLRTDVALAAMTESEALGEEVPVGYLLRTAEEVGHLVGAVEAPRVRRLLERLVDLATAIVRPRTLNESGETAPARLLSGLAWRRARAMAGKNAQMASTALATLLERIDRQNTDPATEQSCRLYRVVGHLPDGRDRIVVYSDLLDLVPRQFGCRQEQVLLPGALVEAVADSDAAVHLEACASQVEEGLVRSPYPSDSALIGQVAHVLQDLAATRAGIDATVLRRSEGTRRELLSLVGAPC